MASWPVQMIGASLFALAVAAPAFGQNPQSPVVPRPDAATPSPGSDRLDCPPGIDERTAPSVGGDTTGSGGSGSRQLSESGGIVCPPAGIDPGIEEPPPAGGTLRIIPPPGSPRGDQSIVPK